MGRFLWPALSRGSQPEAISKGCSVLGRVKGCLYQLLGPHAGKPMAAGSDIGDQALDVVSVTFMFNLWQDTIITELVLFLPNLFFLRVLKNYIISIS